jgi:hypothetical protein
MENSKGVFGPSPWQGKSRFFHSAISKGDFMIDDNSKHRRDVTNIGGDLADHVQNLLDEGHSPFVVADAMILAGSSLWLEVTKSKSLAETFGVLSGWFAKVEAENQKEIRH